MTNKKDILLVDDDRDVLDTLKAHLQGTYAIRTAGSGAECRKEVAKRRPDLVVMDVIMDGVMDGLETAKKIKDDPATKDLPIIMLTSVNEVFDYRAHVSDDYFPRDRWLDKPVDADRLKAAIAGLLGT